ncbi:unnamed protein product [Stenotrophomonas maltophilia]|nr:unnamed protein product [Stenotrophomonas maltophilia]
MILLATHSNKNARLASRKGSKFVMGQCVISRLSKVGKCRERARADAFVRILNPAWDIGVT